jgi:cytidylate kinase
MDCSVVCIARTLGSQGEEIARLVAEKANFRYIDEEVVLQAAELGSVDVEQIQDAEKRRSMVQRLVDGFGAGGTYKSTDAYGGGAYVFSPKQDSASAETAEELRQLIKDAIANIAAHGSAVIAAHAASFALREDARALRVFVTASRGSRSKRLAESGLDSRAADLKVLESDLARADYLKRFYSVNEENSTHYDLTINTDRMSPEQAADLIVSLVQVRETASA